MTARVEAEHRALEGVLRRLGTAGLRRPVFTSEARESWNAKDVLAHVTAWKWGVYRAMWRHLPPAARTVTPPPRPEGQGVMQRNAAIWRSWHRRPAREVVADHRACHAALLRALSALPDEFFAGRDRSPQWPFDAVGHVAEHRRRHLEPLLARRPRRARRARA